MNKQRLFCLINERWVVEFSKLKEMKSKFYKTVNSMEH